LVFVTKRRGVFADEMLTRCEEVMRNVCADFGAELIDFNGEEDHVHLLVPHPPKIALSNLVNSLKGVSSRYLSSRYLRRQFTDHVNQAIMHSRLWSGSYSAGSCGGAPLTTVKNYIANHKHPA
jgi:putative transposase